MAELSRLNPTGRFTGLASTTPNTDPRIRLRHSTIFAAAADLVAIP